MRNQHATLDGLLDVMRDEPALSDDALRSLLDRTPPATTSVRRWPIALLLVAAVGALTWLAATDDVPTQRSAINPVGADDTQAVASSASPAMVGALDGIAAPVPTMSEIDSSPAPIARSLREPAPMIGASDAVGSPRRSDEPTDGRTARLSVPVRVEPSRVIELSSAELAAIGVCVSDGLVLESYGDGFSITHIGDAPPRLDRSITVRRFIEDEGTSESIGEAEIPRGVVPATGPKIVTDLKGNRRFFVASPDRHPVGKADLVSHLRDSIERARLFKPMNVDGLIPIKVSETDGRRLRDELILWYTPSAALFDALPPCLREQLTTELDPAARAELEQSRTHARDAARRIPTALKPAYDSLMRRTARVVASCDRPLPGGRLLDVRRSHDGAITASALAPSNFRLSTRLRIELSEARTLRISLYDLQGRTVRADFAVLHLPQGTSQAELPFEGVPEGLYLVVVESDRGERSVLRAAVE